MTTYHCLKISMQIVGQFETEQKVEKIILKI